MEIFRATDKIQTAGAKIKEGDELTCWTGKNNASFFDGVDDSFEKFVYYNGYNRKADATRIANKLRDKNSKNEMYYHTTVIEEFELENGVFVI